MKLRKIFKDILKLFLAGFIAIAILSVFTLPYDYSGTREIDLLKATEFKWGESSLKTNMKEGFAWIRLDENGYNNADSYSSKDIDILVMGSSHMEALNVLQKESVSYVLGELLGKNTYNIGIQGHTLIHNISNMENAVKYYEPKEYVILETNKIFIDEDSMKHVINGEDTTLNVYDDKFFVFLQKYFPSIKSLMKSIMDWKNNSSIDGGVEQDDLSDEESEISTSYQYTLQRFLSIANKSIKSKGVKLIIFYHSEINIDERGNIIESDEQDEIAVFTDVCNNLDIGFIDMTKEINNLYYTDNVFARGFCNTGVGEGHLNKYGHRLIAETLAKYIISK